MAKPEVVLLTKSGCHLCTEARAAVERVTTGLGLNWSEQLVDHLPDLREKYAEEIPVLLVDGVQRDFWTIDEYRLERLLQRMLAG